MSTDVIKANWKNIQGKLKEQFGKLTDNDLKVIDGQTDQLLAKLQEYGYSKAKIDELIEGFSKDYSCSIKENVINTFSDIKASAAKVGDELLDHSKKVVNELNDNLSVYGKKATETIQEQPIKAITFAAVAGLIIGLLLKK